MLQLLGLWASGDEVRITCSLKVAHQRAHGTRSPSCDPSNTHFQSPDT